MFSLLFLSFSFFFFNDTATTEIYTLSLHDALPISPLNARNLGSTDRGGYVLEKMVYYSEPEVYVPGLDRKSTRLNSSHTVISYAVFCLKKKKKTKKKIRRKLSHDRNKITSTK